MSCGRRECKKGIRGKQWYCRCGLEFCSETCFLSEWHADHSRSCLYATAIKREQQESRSMKKGTALLLELALSRRKPLPKTENETHSGTVPTDTPVIESSMPGPGPVSGYAEVAALSQASKANVVTPCVAAGSTVVPEFAVPSTARPAAAAVTSNGSCNTSVARDVPTVQILRPAETTYADASHSLERLDAAIDTSTDSASCTLPAETPRGEKRRTGKPQLRRYKLEEFTLCSDILGGGSYGQVTKAVHRETGQVFAMKAIPKKKVLEQNMLQYLIREVKTQINMNHPNILRLYYFFEDANDVLLLLEFAAGGSLFSVMRVIRCLGEPQAAHIFVDTAGALGYLHKKNIVHRDLKPENILMVGNVAKLADFGWCAELDGAQRNTFCGTWDYISPEMAIGEPHDFRVDVWATGVLVYEMLTGQAPFAGAGASQHKALQRIKNVDFAFPDSVSVLARDLVLSLLKRVPQERIGLTDAMCHAWVQKNAPERVPITEKQANRKGVAELPMASLLKAPTGLHESRILDQTMPLDHTVAASPL